MNHPPHATTKSRRRPSLLLSGSAATMILAASSRAAVDAAASAPACFAHRTPRGGLVVGVGSVGGGGGVTPPFPPLLLPPLGGIRCYATSSASLAECPLPPHSRGEGGPADPQRRRRRRDGGVGIDGGGGGDGDGDCDGAISQRQQQQSRQQQQQQRLRPDQVRIVLTREEEELFCLLRTAAAECGMSSSTLRVAGGWVRDKILASGEFDRVAPDPPPGGGVASDSSDLLRWSHSSHSSSGGAALSLLSGTVPVDIDIALDDRLGREFADVLSRWLRSNDIVRRADVGVVQENPVKSRHLGTASMRLGRYWIDFANLRAGETYAHGSRIPESTRAGTPREDAHRRDLTINSLFYNINEGVIEDMTGRGLDDLRGGVISTPLPPLTTLLDDPLRALRAVRFASRLGFGMSDDLRGAVADSRVREALERKVSRERIGDEVDLMLRGRDPVGAMGLLVGLGLAGTVFPHARTPVPPPPPSSSTTSSSSPPPPRGGVVVFGGCVRREGLALLAEAHRRLRDNGASPPGWCDARRARRDGAVNGVGGEGCGQALVLADDEDARRMLWYAAFLKPLRDRCAVASVADGGRRDDDEDEEDAGGGGAGPIPPTTKRANRSAVAVLLVDGLKRPARDAEAVERIMKAADGFTGLVSRGGDVSALPVLLSGARVFRAAASGKDDYDDDEIPAGGGDRREGREGGGGGRVLCTMDNRLVDPDTEDDPVWRHNMEFRTNCAEILRDVGQLWRAAFVLSMCEQLVRCKDHEVEYTCGGELVREAPEEVAIGIVENYNDFAAAMMQLGLIGIWNQRPLLDGGEIAGDATVLPNVPRGPEFRRVMEAQTRWLTSHPGGRRGALVEHLRSVFPEYSLSI